MITVHLVLMLLAIVLFLLAALGVGWSEGVTPSPRWRSYNLMAGGLCLWALATIVTV
jgi:hypothetical protein